MTFRTSITSAVLALGLVLLPGCEAPDSIGGKDEEITRMWVAPERAECVGVGPMMCLMIAYAEDEEPGFFYSEMEGFEHVPGTRYVIDVAVTENPNPPMDGSSLDYRLVEVIESESVSG